MEGLATPPHLLFRRSARPQELPRDHEPLDLARSLADLRELRVPEHPLDRVVRDVAVPAVNLDRLVRYEGGHLARVQLRHGGLLLEREATVLAPRGVPDERPRRVDPHRHVRDHELDRLVVRDRLAELDAILRVRDGGLEGALRNPDRHRADADPAAVEEEERVHEALVLLSEKRVPGHLALREEDLRGGAPPHAELVLDLPDRQARVSALDDERADPAVTLPCV